MVRLKLGSILWRPVQLQIFSSSLTMLGCYIQDLNCREYSIHVCCEC